MIVIANIVRGLFMALSVAALVVSFGLCISIQGHPENQAPAVAAAVAGVAWAMLAFATVYGLGRGDGNQSGSAQAYIPAQDAYPTHSQRYGDSHQQGPAQPPPPAR